MSLLLAPAELPDVPEGMVVVVVVVALDGAVGAAAEGVVVVVVVLPCANSAPLVPNREMNNAKGSFFM